MQRFRQRVTNKLKSVDENTKEDDLHFSQTATGYYMAYRPNYPENTNRDFIVYQDLNGSIFVRSNMDALVPTINHYENIVDFEERL